MWQCLNMYKLYPEILYTDIIGQLDFDMDDNI